MNQRLQKTLLLLFLLTLPGILSAQARVETAPSPGAVIVTDMRGRVVELPDRIESIIALSAGSLRLLSYFDSIDKVIAVEDSGHGREKSPHDFFYLATYRIAFPRLQELPSIGSSENHEAIIAAAPDIIFSTTVDVSRLDQLQDILGIPIFALDADVELNDPERFFDQIEVLGNILSEGDRARSLIAGIEDALNDVSARRDALQEPRRAYAGGMMFYGPADLLRTSGDYIPFDYTGTQNVMPSNPAGSFQPYMTSLEELIASAPEYVFVDAANSELARRGFEANREVLLEHVPAFTHRDVYTTLVYKYYGTNWENQLINIFFVGTVLYPELYENIDIVQKAEEIWELFFQVPLTYSKVMELQGPGLGPADWY